MTPPDPRTAEERLRPEELAYLRGNDEGYRRGYAHAMRDCAALAAEPVPQHPDDGHEHHYTCVRCGVDNGVNDRPDPVPEVDDDDE